MSSATTPTGRSQIPVDIMLIILDNLDKSDLATMCRLNKICCASSQPVLFRDIRIQYYQGDEFNERLSIRPDRGFALCWILSQSPHLARCVRSFFVMVYEISMCFGEKIAETLEFLPSLRHLGLNVYNDFIHQLNGRTFSFKLKSFSFYSYDIRLQNFLNSQPSLTTIDIRLHDPRHLRYLPRLEFERKCMPNLTRVTTHIFSTDAEEIIRGRPVSEITCIGQPNIHHNITLGFFALSTAPIRKLTIDFEPLYYGEKPGQLRELFPSLTHLTLTSPFEFPYMILMRVSLCLLIRLYKHVIARQ
jgi:hypothetical protein